MEASDTAKLDAAISRAQSLSPQEQWERQKQAALKLAHRERERNHMRQREAKAAYREYLKTPHWQCIRNWALDRAGQQCQVCAKQYDLEVHHNNYNRKGKERPTDLVVLCRTCHQIYHDAEVLL